jgi:membrane fusion protein, multidrug efflux system
MPTASGGNIANSRMELTAKHPFCPSRERVRRAARRPLAKLWVGTAMAIAAFGTSWLVHLYRDSGAVAHADSAAPQVVASKPLVRELNSRLGFLGQFSAVDEVELRAQAGGTLTEINFRDGEIVHKGDLLFTIDARPYQIKLAEATAKLETATARFALADPYLLICGRLEEFRSSHSSMIDYRTDWCTIFIDAPSKSSILQNKHPLPERQRK